MQPDQTLQRLGPRMKLLKRHLREWNDLLNRQKQVRQFVREQEWQQVSGYIGTRADVLSRINEQVLKLTQSHARQTEERQHMKERHQQEEADLEQLLAGL